MLWTGFARTRRSAPVGQSEINARRWRRGDQVALYAGRELTPAEVVLLVRYRSAISGRVLEIGCGGGRVLGYLAALSREAHGVDISAAMVEHCRLRYPAARVQVGDAAHLTQVVQGPFDAIVAAANVLDVFEDVERRRVLSDIRALLGAGGLLIFSSHNLAALNASTGTRPRLPWYVRGVQSLRSLVDRPPTDFVHALVRIPRRARNRRRLGGLQKHTSRYAIVNDDALDFGLLHYYIRRDDQERQLSEVGYELVECLDGDGRQVQHGNEGLGSSLHYVARAS
jgi:SAM-dependent methyltransferase